MGHLIVEIQKFKMVACTPKISELLDVILTIYVIETYIMHEYQMCDLYEWN